MGSPYPWACGRHRATLQTRPSTSVRQLELLSPGFSPWRRQVCHSHGHPTWKALGAISSWRKCACCPRVHNPPHRIEHSRHQESEQHHFAFSSAFLALTCPSLLLRLIASPFPKDSKYNCCFAKFVSLPGSHLRTGGAALILRLHGMAVLGTDWGRGVACGLTYNRLEPKWTLSANSLCKWAAIILQLKLYSNRQ